ncbi:MAG: phosphatase domain-containing protein [Thermodesulfobacteriota bacterium]
MSEARVSDGGAPAAVEQAAITFRWDLDKTYLRTQFESLRQMVKIPFEAASDKVHLPGVPQVIQGLRRCALARAQRPFVFFLSASPPQIGNAIREKLELDGIEYDGIIFKDQLRNLVRGRWRSLREQIGYKLGELLESRERGPAAPREILFGDDWESDPLIYSVYADVLAGRLDAGAVGDLLRTLEVERGAIARVSRAVEALESHSEVVQRIYINLEKRTPPGRFHAFGPRLVPAFNYFQTGASLFELGLIDDAALTTIANALVEEASYSGDRLRNSLDDLVRRGHLRPSSRTRIIRILQAAAIAGPAPHEAMLRARLRAAFERLQARWRRGTPAEQLPELDYAQILRDWTGREV